MATLYVRSTDGSDADGGTTWALAKASLNGAAAIDAAGDTIYVSQSHSETSSAADVTLSFAGTLASPVKLICGNDAAEPPTAVATTGAFALTGTGNDLLINGNLYCYGLSFELGPSGAVNQTYTLNSSGTTANAIQVYDNCVFKISSSGSGCLLATGLATNASPAFVEWRNVTAKFASSAGGGIVVNGEFVWDGGGLVSGHTSSSLALVRAGSSGRASLATLSGLDLQHLGASQHLFAASSNNTRFIARNCRMPTSWTGSLVTGTKIIGDYFALFNCDSADTNYQLWVETYAGIVRSETVIVRTGGASDGTTTLSWKMSSAADAEYPTILLESPEIVRWNETTGSAITVTVEIITDNVTLTDGECWLEVQYLGTSGVPLGTFGNDAKADVLATAANQTTSSETWTTTGLGTPVKQKLAMTFTPQEKGFIHAIVKLAKASTTVYVDPELTVT